jgi:3D (Asp-Asp-Asp) domain-containing protein
MRKVAYVVLIMILTVASTTLINPTDSLATQSEVNLEKGGMEGTSAKGESDVTNVAEQLDDLLADVEQSITTLSDKTKTLEASVNSEYTQYLQEQREKEEKEKQRKQATLPSRGGGEVGTELYVSATAYTAYCSGCSGTTTSGINLRSNPNAKVIAVDPSVIPLGSKVWVEGYGYAIAADTGGAIKGNKIDVFIPTKSAAYQWGRKTVRIKILE